MIFWYAILDDAATDNDYSNGTFNKRTARTMLNRRRKEGYKNACIAIIDAGYKRDHTATKDTFCVDIIF